ncbi:MAG: hypothetical protein EOO89_15525 [Pedobacter sp.]|nr:MAG: hypothetical protein EOO89_15525 [Pedobacter sp.]
MKNLKKFIDLMAAKAYLFCIITLFYPVLSYGQTLPIGSPQETIYRNLQLRGQVPLSSFSVRPTLHTGNEAESDSLLRSFTTDLKGITFLKGKGELRLLPVSWKQQVNTSHPFGWNDGAMIPSKGYQSQLSAGVYAKIGPVSIQLQPEFVYAANEDHGGFASGKSDADIESYYKFHTYIDVPERFGNGSYTKVFLGQSSLRVNFDPVSVGLSTENLWWGPGIQNALLLGNNAPGFRHLTLNTTRPVKTPIGSFEAQIVGGKLEQSGYSPLLQTTNSAGEELYIPPKNEWRYFTGLNINYQPKWIPGLTLGFIRTFMAYHSDLKKFSDYVPFFVKLQKETGDQDDYDRDQRISLYTRWLFQKAMAEVYFEYGLNDNAYNFRDFIGSPEHGRSYLFGFNKLVNIPGKKDQFIQINAEVTQLSQTVDRVVRPAGGFYQHFGINQGYTHKGQVLGAGIGTGSNHQALTINWLNGVKRLGFAIERLEHNLDLYNESIKDLNGFSRKWVDYALSLNGQWDHKKFIVNAKFQGIQSLNYQWLLKDYIPGNYYIPNNDVFNFRAELSVMYRF